MKKIVLAFVVVSLIAALSAFLYFESLKKDVNFDLGWDNKSGKKIIETTHLQVPESSYNDFFAEILGSDTWDNAKKLYKKQAGFLLFEFHYPQLILYSQFLYHQIFLHQLLYYLN